MATVMLTIGFMAFAALAVVAFIFNSQTPMQVGPIPVVGGGILSLICLIALIARLSVRG